jgi:hypothetical protein
VCVFTLTDAVCVCVCGVHGCGIERLLLLPIHSCWCESWPKLLHVRVLLFVVTLPNLGVGFTSPSSGGRAAIELVVQVRLVCEAG